MNQTCHWYNIAELQFKRGPRILLNILIFFTGHYYINNFQVKKREEEKYTGAVWSTFVSYSKTSNTGPLNNSEHGNNRK